MARVFWTGVAIVAVVALFVWEPGAFRGVVATGVRLLVIGLAAAFGYQSFDALRSAATGSQPKASAPDANPESVSARMGGLAWGLMAGAVCLAGLSWAFGLWGHFPSALN